MTSKRLILASLVVVAALATTASPVFAISEAKSEAAANRAATKAADQQAKRCDAITTIATTAQSRISERVATVQSNRTKHESNIDTRLNGRTEAISAKRAGWDTQRQAQYAKLRESAKTDAQKAAVEQFIASLQAAITTRRSTNDVAFATFRTDVEAIKATVNANLGTISSTASSDVAAAIAKAQADCAAGQDPATVKATLKTSLDSARAGIKTKRTTTNISTPIQAAAQKRNNSVKANDAAFKATVSAARTQLEAAFKPAP